MESLRIHQHLLIPSGRLKNALMLEVVGLDSNYYVIACVACASLLSFVALS